MFEYDFASKEVKRQLKAELNIKSKKIYEELLRAKEEFKLVCTAF